MDDITFMNDFIRMAKPPVALRYSLLDEGRLLVEMDRAEQLASTAHERKREETETKKIFAALEKEKHDAAVVKKRHQQLMQNTYALRRLRQYVTTAETTRDLVAQLKLEDEMIERRFEEARKQAEELRAQYRCAEERDKKLEEKKRLDAKRLREDLRAQMTVHDMQRAELRDEKIQDGKELWEKLRGLDEHDRLKQEAKCRAKLQWRQEILESLCLREEYFRIQNAKDLKSLQDQNDARDRMDKFDQNVKDCRNQRIEERRKISAKIGGKILAAENEKRNAIASLIDMFVNERIAKEQLAEQYAAQKELETRQMLQYQAALHWEQQLAQKERQKQKNLEFALKRKPITPEEQDRPRESLRRLDQIRDNQIFMAEKREIDREKSEREAEDRRQQYEYFVKQTRDHDNEVENAKKELLDKSSIGLLRYFPSSVVRSDYLPQPIRDRVREAVRNDPIPILTKKRHQPHLRSHHNDEAEPVRCCKTCPNPILSNVF